MRSTAFALILALIVFTAACAQEPPAANVPAAPSDDVPSGGAAQEPDVTFTLTGENFRFRMDGEVNPELRVQQGDLVRIEFSSADGFHDWVNDEFEAATERVRPEEGMTVVEFVADEAGEFFYYCSVGSHRAQGMEGRLIVE